MRHLNSFLSNSQNMTIFYHEVKNEGAFLRIRRWEREREQHLHGCLHNRGSKLTIVLLGFSSSRVFCFFPFFARDSRKKRAGKNRPMNHLQTQIRGGCLQSPVFSHIVSQNLRNLFTHVHPGQTVICAKHAY